MALIVATRRPNALLLRIREAIRDGEVTTWVCDPDGDFTHMSDQWGGRLWLSPRANGVGHELVFRTVPRKEQRISTSAYAFYHGHFAQMLLTHFDDGFDTVLATAQPARGDRLR